MYYIKRHLTYFTSSWAYSVYSTLAVVMIYLSTRPSPAPVAINSICSVIEIIDGDSLVVRCGKKHHNLRLMHIDAPEITQANWGDFAKQQLSMHARKNVFVEFYGKDIYQRDLALIYAPHTNKNINLQLVKKGIVRVYSRYAPENYRLAMKNAKKAKLGIWIEKGLHQDPMRYRRLAY